MMGRFYGAKNSIFAICAFACVWLGATFAGAQSPAGSTDAVPAKLAAAAKARPNVILIVTDDHRADCLSCAGHPILKTPHLDALAARGVRFSNTFCTTSICAVSRASILTGQYARRHGIHEFSTPLNEKQFAESIPGVLKAAGYRTGFVGKWGVGNTEPKEAFDFWEGFPGQGRYFQPNDVERTRHITDAMRDRALEFITSGDPTPFFLQISTKAPHAQDGAPREFPPAKRHEALYADAVIPEPPLGTEADFLRQPEFLHASESRVRWKPRFATPEKYQASVKDYLRLITGVDEMVGAIVARLAERKHLDDTIFVVIGDNGFFLGERGFADKWYMYEESIRVPLIICDPRTLPEARGRVEPAMALNIDVAPTLFELLDLTTPADVQGRSLGPFVYNEQVAPWRHEFFYEHLFKHPKIPKSEGVRTDRWAYIRWIEQTPVYEELFDLENDPHEKTNLAADPAHAETLNVLRKQWEHLREEAK